MIRPTNPDQEHSGVNVRELGVGQWNRNSRTGSGLSTSSDQIRMDLEKKQGSKKLVD